MNLEGRKMQDADFQPVRNFLGLQENYSNLLLFGRLSFRRLNGSDGGDWMDLRRSERPYEFRL